MDIGRAVELAEAITAARRRTVVIISTHATLVTDNLRIISGGSISISPTERLPASVALFDGCGGLTVPHVETTKPGLPILIHGDIRRSCLAFGMILATSANRSAVSELTSGTPLHSRRRAGSIGRRFEAAEQSSTTQSLTFDWYIRLISMMLVDTGRYGIRALIAGDRGAMAGIRVASVGRHFVVQFWTTTRAPGCPSSSWGQLLGRVLVDPIGNGARRGECCAHQPRAAVLEVRHDPGQAVAVITELVAMPVAGGRHMSHVASCRRVEWSADRPKTVFGSQRRARVTGILAEREEKTDATLHHRYRNGFWSGGRVGGAGSVHLSTLARDPDRTAPSKHRVRRGAVLAVSHPLERRRADAVLANYAVAGE
jgi:hypothetical protein